MIKRLKIKQFKIKLNKIKECCHLSFGHKQRYTCIYSRVKNVFWLRNTNRACFVQDIPHTDKWIKTRCFILHNPKCNTEQQQLEKETKRENIKDTVWLVDKCEHKQTVHFITHVIVLLNKVEIAIN